MTPRRFVRVFCSMSTYGSRALLLLVTSTCACHEAPTTFGPNFSGQFSAGFEVSSFQPCGSDEQWWVEDGSDLYQRYNQLGLPEYAPAFAAVEGVLSAPGTYGHLGAYSRQFQVTRVLAVRRPSIMDCR